MDIGIYLHILLSVVFLWSFPFSTVAQQAIVAESLAAEYALQTSTMLPFPAATLSPTAANIHLVSQWSLNKGRIQQGAENLAFVVDPYPNDLPMDNPSSTNATVLQVTYPQGSFSYHSGTTFHNAWNVTTFNTMLLSYEVAFDVDFDWVKGGKLPGLRGGPSSAGCGGEHRATGSDCFSSVVMWRRWAAGEGYAYIPTANGLCERRGILCNNDAGVSMQRGSFGFEGGRWQRITMLVRVNDPPNVANGNIQLYYNDLQAFSETNLQLRKANTVSIDGLHFSSFFGGSDHSWASPKTQRAYFRNVRMWGSSAPSNLTGQVVENAALHTRLCSSKCQLVVVCVWSLFLIMI